MIMIQMRDARNVLIVLAVILHGGSEAQFNQPLTFERLSQMSDRIIVGTNLGPTGEPHTYPNGVTVHLGIKDPATGKVFTPYGIRVSTCVFDKNTTCTPGSTEIFIPGGTVFDTINGESGYYTTEIARAPTIPPKGTEVLLFMRNFSGRFVPINDVGARLKVDTASGGPKVRLHFSSPALMSAAGRDAALQHLSGSDIHAHPAFTEDVPIDLLKEMVIRARTSPGGAQP